MTLVLPSKACLLLVKDPQVHARLRAHILELAMYGVGYRVEEAGCPLLDHLREASMQGGQAEEVALDPILHEDTLVKFPSERAQNGTNFKVEAGWKLFFDGRSAKAKGSGGYVCFNQEGRVMGGAAMNFGEGCTNNTAELEALLQGL